MPEAKWNRAKDVFHQALAKSGPDRARFVDDACGNDAEVRAQVEALLAAHDAAGNFLVLPTTSAGASAMAAGAGQEQPGTRIGPYKLLQLIGEGGFGEVYMAEQEEPIRRRVALKIIKPGMGTKEVIARFESERQALALMDHPNIAKVFDAGATESGRPYFVMELVKGVPITDYCDANRLSTRERLDLFVQVCKAVHHAHEKGIVHRDIKPSNVMVTLHDGTPVPKVIDFGVAKATNQRLTEKTLFTAYGACVGTPVYMSPEQAEMSGLEVDRRSDIYSLGVLLYELLTGTTPFNAERLRAAAFIELLRIIREEDPPTPSNRLSTLGDQLADIAGKRSVDPNLLTKLVRGDLDWIVMKTIDKDRRRRYDTVSDLVADMSRYFKDEPVIARRPSTAYRIGKFAKRHRVPLVAAAGIAGALVIGGTLAHISGFVANGSSNVPSRRLFFDNNQLGRVAFPTQDGRHVLQYNGERRGFDLLEVGSGRITALTRSGGPDPWSLGDYSLAPDRGQIVAVHGNISDPNRRQSAAELRVHAVGGDGEGRLLTSWEPGHDIKVIGWSPDQKTIWVFAMRPDKAAEITAVTVANGSRRILRTLAWRTHTQPPSLSRDGKLIAYHDHDRPESPPDIFLMSTNGSAPIRVEHPASDSKPLFTPDGSGVVFQSDRKGGDLWFLPVVDGRPAGEPRPVWGDLGAFGVANTFSENGSLIYFFRTNRWEIHAARIDIGRGVVGTPEHLPPLRGEMNNAPAFSPDGQLLAHLRDRGRRLVLRDLATNVEREIPIAGSLTVPSIDFCPDSRSVIVSGSESSGPVVYHVKLERGGAERFDVPATRAVCVAAEGRDIVYLRPLGQRRYEVMRRSLSRGVESKLHDGLAEELNLTRSADGSRIAFVEQRGDQAQLVVMPSTGGDAVTVAVSPRKFPWSEFQGVMWLPDGKGLLVSRKAFDDPSLEVTLWRVPLDGGPASAVGRMPLPAYEGAGSLSLHYSLHPDGSRLVFERHGGTLSQYWAIDNLAQFIKSGAAVAIPPDSPGR